MKKFNINGITQGLIIMTLGLIANTTLLVLLLLFFKSENFAFLIVFGIIEIMILFVINDLIKERKKK